MPDDLIYYEKYLSQEQKHISHNQLFLSQLVNLQGKPNNIMVKNAILLIYNREGEKDIIRNGILKALITDPFL